MNDGICNFTRSPTRFKDTLSEVRHFKFEIRSLVILILILSASLAQLNGDWSAESKVLDIVVFKEPEFIKPPKIVYPPRQFLYHEEGWVRLRAVIDLEGRPTEIVVTDSVGDKSFHTAAYRALKNSKFQPGEQNGEKVESKFWWQVTYELKNKTAFYHRPFKRLFIGVVSDIGENRKSKALSGLESLRKRKRTLHEDAMYWTAKYYFDQVWGSTSEQLASINRALGYDETRRYVDANLRQKLLWSKFHLQIDRKLFADALDTLSMFVELDGIDESILKQAIEYKKAIDALATAGTAYAIDASIDRRGRWDYALLRNHFGITDVEGLVDEFIVSCQRDRFRFEYAPDFEYELDGTNGDCSVAVVGEPGTSFRFIQL